MDLWGGLQSANCLVRGWKVNEANSPETVAGQIQIQLWLQRRESVRVSSHGARIEVYDLDRKEPITPAAPPAPPTPSICKAPHDFRDYGDARIFTTAAEVQAFMMALRSDLGLAWFRRKSTVAARVASVGWPPVRAVIRSRTVDRNEIVMNMEYDPPIDLWDSLFLKPQKRFRVIDWLRRTTRRGYIPYGDDTPTT